MISARNPLEQRLLELLDEEHHGIDSWRALAIALADRKGTQVCKAG